MASLPTILLVDDDQNITDSLEMLLEDDYDVLTFNDPLEALEEVKKNKDISLIISDFRMPQMEGSEFLTNVAGINKNIYRMILTGYADAKTLLEKVNDGTIQKRLMKPWNPELLCSIVDKKAHRPNAEH